MWQSGACDICAVYNVRYGLFHIGRFPYPRCHMLLYGFAMDVYCSGYYRSIYARANQQKHRIDHRSSQNGAVDKLPEKKNILL